MSLRNSPLPLGSFQLETNAVISSEPRRQLWTEEFGPVRVDDEIGRIISDRLPNLVYKAVFRLVPSVDFAQMDPRDVKLDDCGKYDGYTFKLEELERLEEVHTELVYQTVSLRGWMNFKALDLQALPLPSAMEQRD